METTIKNQIINNYLSQQLMETQDSKAIITVPTSGELEDFKNFVRVWMEMDDTIKKLQVILKEKKMVKQELSYKILEFMSKYNIEDLNTKDGKLRYKVTRVKVPLSQNSVKNKIVSTFSPGMKPQELVDKVFERETKESHTLKRFK